LFSMKSLGNIAGYEVMSSMLELYFWKAAMIISSTGIITVEKRAANTKSGVRA